MFQFRTRFVAILCASLVLLGALSMPALAAPPEGKGRPVTVVIPPPPVTAGPITVPTPPVTADPIVNPTPPAVEPFLTVTWNHLIADQYGFVLTGGGLAPGNLVRLYISGHPSQMFDSFDVRIAPDGTVNWASTSVSYSIGGCFTDAFFGAFDPLGNLIRTPQPFPCN